MIDPRFISAVVGEWRAFVRSQKAATAVEYALIGTVMFLAMFTYLQAFGSELQSAFLDMASSIDDAT